jgi:hypothetical protein
MSLEPVGPRWLPPSAEPPSTSVLRVDALNRVALVGFGIAAPLFVVVSAVRGWRHPSLRRRAALSMTLLAGTFAQSAFSNYWAFYNEPFVLGTVALAAVVAPPLFERSGDRLFLGAALVVHVFALVSVGTTFAHVAPRLVALWREGRGMAVPERPGWVPALGFAPESAKIRALASTCEIPPKGARRLVIDDATLFAFDDLREPLHLFYVSDANMWGGDILGGKNVTFLRDLGAPGIISRCPYFPTALAARARKADGYCCVSRADLESE